MAFSRSASLQPACHTSLGLPLIWSTDDVTWKALNSVSCLVMFSARVAMERFTSVPCSLLLFTFRPHRRHLIRGLLQLSGSAGGVSIAEQF